MLERNAERNADERYPHHDPHHALLLVGRVCQKPDGGVVPAALQAHLEALVKAEMKNAALELKEHVDTAFELQKKANAANFQATCTFVQDLVTGLDKKIER